MYREREMRTLESDCDLMIKTLNDQNVYYRITYHGEGIYNALKNIVGMDTWRDLLNNQNVNWLPKPPEYSSKNISYFTKKGYEFFIEKTLPTILNYLDKENIQINHYNDINNNILYTDEYQIVIEISEK